MQGKAERLPRSRWGWARPVAVTTGVLTAVAGVALPAGVTVPAGAATRTFSSLPAATIVARARSAMLAAGSVRATGTGTVAVPGAGKATVRESDYAGPASGDQVLHTLDSRLPSGAVLPTASVVDVNGGLYAKGNLGFWVSSAGVSEPQASLLVGKWVHIPAGSSAYGPVAADLTMASLAKDLFHGSGYRKGPVTTVDGVTVVPITYTNSGADSGKSTCDVAVGGRHLPVSWTISGLHLHFVAWGKRKPVAVPPGSIELPNQPPSSQPTVPSSPGGTVVT